METAWLEAQQGFAFKPQPLTICAYDVDCDDLADLRDVAERERCDAPLEMLAGAWEYHLCLEEEPSTWRLAARLQEARAAGILVPSFAPGATSRDMNLVLWEWSEALPHRVLVIDDEGRLPRDDRSWR